VEHGFLAAMPSPRVVPAALNLLAGVSPLLEARSARLWTLWLARVHDPSSALFAALCERTPVSQFGVQEHPTENRPLRAAALRTERDRLLAQSAELRALAERDQQELAKHRMANDELRAKLDALGTEAAECRAKIRELEQVQESPSSTQAQLTAQLEAARRALLASDDDSRDIVTLAAEVARTRRVLEMKNDGLRQRVADLENFCDELERAAARTKSDTNKARAERAERELAKAHEVRETAQAGVKVLAEKLERRKFQLHSLQKHIESMEIELAQADVELKMRRTRMFSPSQAEIDAVRQAEAARMRKIQEKRQPLTDEDEASAGRGSR
jgi:chromosome segregation ATPase